MGALVLIALVPAVCVLWFMTIAMRNERLAVQEQVADVHLKQLVSVRRQVDLFWRGRREALQAAPTQSPAEQFAYIIRRGLADSAIVYDTTGRRLYPSPDAATAAPDEPEAWAAAEELVLDRKDHAAAAAAFRRIAESSRDIHTKARALQAEATCWLQDGNERTALGRLAQLTGDATLRDAIGAQGTLVVPNAQLLLLNLLDQTHATRRRHAAALVGPTGAHQTDEVQDRVDRLAERTLAGLIDRLNGYDAGVFSAAQRRFLMHEVRKLAPDAATFPTLAAEDLAAEYVDSNPSPPTETKLQRTALPKVWRLTTADRTIVALYQEDRFKAELAGLFDTIALPNVRVRLVAPGEPFVSSKVLPPQDAGEMLPGWRFGLAFRGDDPLAAASARQTRFYLWAGFMVVVIIALLALLVARYVGAQMRLARLKNELVSTVSHELRTPLASMRALVETLATGRYHDQHQLRDYLALIARENHRLSHVIENFLTFSRLERGKQRYRFETLAPADVLEAAVRALAERLESIGCRFAREVDSDAPMIRGDADALTTVLINLLDNACKYSERDKHITARIRRSGPDVCFEVQDNGIGLTPSETKRIFARFYQVDQSLTRSRGGCGLGLSIVQSIVVAHGGTVEVESQPGQGSTFRVRIPASVQRLRTTVTDGPEVARTPQSKPGLETSVNSGSPP